MMLKKEQYYELFTDTSVSRDVHLQEKVETTVAFFVENTHFTVHIDAKYPNSKGEIFIFVPAKFAHQSSITLDAHISASQVQLSIHLIAIQNKESQIQMQGGVTVGKGVHQVETHLLEEAILLDGAKYTTLQPVLNIASPDVKASHGAKIHRISSEKLFYLQSKGLNPQNAENIILESYGKKIIEKFDDKEGILSVLSTIYD